jgi:hypothetical protein
MQAFDPPRARKSRGVVRRASIFSSIYSCLQPQPQTQAQAATSPCTACNGAHRPHTCLSWKHGIELRRHAAKQVKAALEAVAAAKQAAAASKAAIAVAKADSMVSDKSWAKAEDAAAIARELGKVMDQAVAKMNHAIAQAQARQVDCTKQLGAPRCNIPLPHTHTATCVAVFGRYPAEGPDGLTAFAAAVKADSTPAYAENK